MISNQILQDTIEGIRIITKVDLVVMDVEGVYDLQGRKLSMVTPGNSSLKKGVYIINGKKVVK